MTSDITDAQRAALKWLREHNGDGIFDKSGVLLAGGERAPVVRSTWNKLADQGLVKFYGGKHGRSRLRLTSEARA